MISGRCKLSWQSEYVMHGTFWVIRASCLKVFKLRWFWMGSQSHREFRPSFLFSARWLLQSLLDPCSPHGAAGGELVMNRLCCENSFNMKLTKQNWMAFDCVVFLFWRVLAKLIFNPALPMTHHLPHRSLQPTLDKLSNSQKSHVGKSSYCSSPPGPSQQYRKYSHRTSPTTDYSLPEKPQPKQSVRESEWARERDYNQHTIRNSMYLHNYKVYKENPFLQLIG